MPTMTTDRKTILRALKGEKTARVPWWLMRQAGRYLPEYRELRAQAGGFLNMVYNPALASEITLQPVRRYRMNGAILFSDILVIPQALGQALRFETGEGPVLDPVTPDTLTSLDGTAIDRTLGPVYDTVAMTAEKLCGEGFDDTALIGFAGAPWTIACYMAEGKGSRDFHAAKIWAVQQPDSFAALIGMITDATIHYLSRQIDAGAEAVQIFDSWAGVADADMFDRWIIAPTVAIVAALKEKYPAVPVIGFPRGAGEKARAYVQKTGVDAIGVDFATDPAWARDHLQGHACVQGNMDPAYLLAGGVEMERAARHVLTCLGDRAFVFNLGHGVIKETNPDSVARLGQIIREYR